MTNPWRPLWSSCLSPLHVGSSICGNMHTVFVSRPVGTLCAVPAAQTCGYSQALAPPMVAYLQRSSLMPRESPRVAPLPAAPVRIYAPHSWSCATHGTFRSESGKCPVGCTRVLAALLWDRNAGSAPSRTGSRLLPDRDEVGRLLPGSPLRHSTRTRPRRLPRLPLGVGGSSVISRAGRAALGAGLRVSRPVPPTFTTGRGYRPRHAPRSLPAAHLQGTQSDRARGVGAGRNHAGPSGWAPHARMDYCDSTTPRAWISPRLAKPNWMLWPGS